MQSRIEDSGEGGGLLSRWVMNKQKITGKRATGGGVRPGARGPGRGPTVVWAQPGCWGFLAPKLQSEELVGCQSVTLLRPSQLAKAPYCALLSAQPRPAAGRAT